MSVRETLVNNDNNSLLIGKALLYLLLFFSLGSCQTSESTSTTDANSINQKPTTANHKIAFPLITTVENLQVRAAPTQAAEVVATLPIDSTITSLGIVSDKWEAILIRGIAFNEPWLQVQANNSTVGWLYGGGVDLANTVPTSEEEKAFLHRRLTGIFGSELAATIDNYQLAYSNIRTPQEFAAVFREGCSLRDSIVKILPLKTEVIAPVSTKNLAWLEAAVPGFKVQLVAEATQYYLFANYADFNQKAIQTSSSEDDRFTDLHFQLYPSDSIENHYPNWFMQTWDYGGHSLLGNGTHLKIFQQIEALQVDTKLFQPELSTIKKELIKDVTADWVTYWEPQQIIQEELAAILQKNLSCITEEEQLLLQQRLIAFDNPSENNISLNQKGVGN